MSTNTPAIGTEPDRSPSDERKTQVTSVGVDAESAEEFDNRHGLALPEDTKFTHPDCKDNKHAGTSAQPSDDPNQLDPNAEDDKESERANPGLHGSGGDAGRAAP